MKYRKKPVVIEAMQWYGRDLSELSAFCCKGLVAGSGAIWLITLEGPLKISAGDYVIKGVKGEVYPCKPDIFEKTYELCEEVENNG